MKCSHEQTKKHYSIFEVMHFYLFMTAFSTLFCNKFCSGIGNAFKHVLQIEMN